ncbi:MAG: ABC transporter ATP-binding protein [Elusimicrobia bacterium]|nr:ABC transporter ATP-binding protein [Elusimicrobiota bacterium]
MAEAIVKAERLTKLYERPAEVIRAVDAADLEVRPGEFVAVMGPSGSGKTTLLDLIGCLDSATSGRLWVLGEEVSGLPEDRLVAVRRGRIGFVFQDASLLPTLTALENVRYGAWLSRKDASAGRARDCLAQVGLGNRAEHFPGQLSGGEMQRAAIARALAVAPRLLIADEPTGNLDSRQAQTIFELLQGLAQEGLTVIWATHNAALGGRCPRVLSLRDGRLFAGAS